MIPGIAFCLGWRWGGYGCHIVKNALYLLIVFITVDQKADYYYIQLISKDLHDLLGRSFVIWHDHI